MAGVVMLLLDIVACGLEVQIIFDPTSEDFALHICFFYVFVLYNNS